MSRWSSPRPSLAPLAGHCPGCGATGPDRWWRGPSASTPPSGRTRLSRVQVRRRPASPATVSRQAPRTPSRPRCRRRARSPNAGPPPRREWRPGSPCRGCRDELWRSNSGACRRGPRPVDPVAQARDAVVRRGGDRLACQVFLRGEVVVESAVGEAGGGHERLHAFRFDAVFPEAPRGGLDDALAGLFLMVFLVSHGSVLRGGNLVAWRVPTAAQGAEGGHRRARIVRMHAGEQVAGGEKLAILVQHFDQADGTTLIGILGGVARLGVRGDLVGE